MTTMIECLEQMNNLKTYEEKVRFIYGLVKDGTIGIDTFAFQLEFLFDKSENQDEKRKRKVVIIEKCHECPFFKDAWGRGDDFCTKMNKSLYNDYIPEDCPLPDKG